MIITFKSRPDGASGSHWIVVISFDSHEENDPDDKRNEKAESDDKYQNTKAFGHAEKAKKKLAVHMD